MHHSQHESTPDTTDRIPSWEKEDTPKVNIDLPAMEVRLLFVILSALCGDAAGFSPAARAKARMPLRHSIRSPLQPAMRANAAPVMLENSNGGKPAAGGLPFFMDPGTKGGIIFYTIVGIALPFFAYSFMIDNLGYDVVLAGNVILVGYVGLGTVVWTGSYVFRVANKDMTYAQQLRDYENAVIQKRFEELSGEEVDALMGEIYPEKPPES